MQQLPFITSWGALRTIDVKILDVRAHEFCASKGFVVEGFLRESVELSDGDD